MPAVWASASAGWTTRPTATANPRKENILRRETIFHCVLSIILTSYLAINHSSLQFLLRLHHAACAIRSAMEGCTPDRTGFAASQSCTIAPSLLGPLKSATLMWSPLVAQPIGSATVTFPYQRHAKPSGSSPPMHKLGKFTKLRVAFLEYAGG